MCSSFICGFSVLLGGEHPVCDFGPPSCVPAHDWPWRRHAAVCDSSWRARWSARSFDWRASHIYCAGPERLQLPLHFQNPLLWVSHVDTMAIHTATNSLFRLNGFKQLIVNQWLFYFNLSSNLSFCALSKQVLGLSSCIKRQKCPTDMNAQTWICFVILLRHHIWFLDLAIHYHSIITAR